MSSVEGYPARQDRFAEIVALLLRAGARFRRLPRNMPPFPEYGWLYGTRFERQKTDGNLGPAVGSQLGRFLAGLGNLTG